MSDWLSPNPPDIADPLFLSKGHQEVDSSGELRNRILARPPGTDVIIVKRVGNGKVND